MTDQVPAIGSRIRDARVRRQMSQSDLGSAVGLDKTILSKIENGVRAVSSIELADLSDALGVSMRDLAGARSPSPILQFAHRLGEGNDEHAAARGRRVLVDVMELDALLDEVGVPRSPETDIPDFARPTADPVASGRQLARDVRTHLDLGMNPIGDIEGLLEDLGVLVIARPLGDESDSLAGVCTNHPRFRAALINTDQWGTRQRFTAAHELGHILFGDAADSWRNDHDADLRTGSTSTEEVRANAFAAELLLPLDVLGVRIQRAGSVTEALFTDTMFDYGVSLQTMAYRLLDGGHLDRDEMEQWRAMSVSNLAWTFNRQAEHRDHGEARGRVRAPSTIHQRAVQAYSLGRIGIGPLAGLLGADPDQLRSDLDEAGLSPTLNHQADVLDLL